MKVLHGERGTVTHSIITVELGVRSMDADKNEFISHNIGTFSVITDRSIKSAELIARLKKTFPDLTKYKNIVILTRELQKVKSQVDMHELLSFLNTQQRKEEK